MVEVGLPAPENRHTFRGTRLEKIFWASNGLSVAPHDTATPWAMASVLVGPPRIDRATSVRDERPGVPIAYSAYGRRRRRGGGGRVRAAPLARRGCRRRRARVAQRRSYAPWSRTRRRRARRVRAPWCVRRARGGGTLNLIKCAKKAPVSSDKTSTETKNTAHHASSHMVLGNFTLRANSLKNIECEEQRKTRCEIRAC